MKVKITLRFFLILTRMAEIKSNNKNTLAFVWGKQDNHALLQGCKCMHSLGNQSGSFARPLEIKLTLGPSISLLAHN